MEIRGLSRVILTITFISLVLNLLQPGYLTYYPFTLNKQQVKK